MRFTERRRVGFGLACIGTAFLAMAAAPAPVRGATLSTDVLPVLSTYATLSAQWWQWILGIPAASNPGLDTTGQFCGTNQSGPVWFLAGTFASEPVTRTCTVPAERALFFPLVNVAVFPDPGDTVDTVRRQASAFINGVNTLQSTVDGRVAADLFGYRTLSPVFSFVVPNDGLLPAGTYGSFNVSDGYWLLVRPLRPGNHVIHMGGHIGGDSPFTVDVTYNLVVQR